MGRDYAGAVARGRVALARRDLARCCARLSRKRRRASRTVIAELLQRDRGSLAPWSRALVLTDFDKSGADIERSAAERIRAFRSEPLELVWERLAITEEQIAEHNLPVVEKWDKRT